VGEAFYPAPAETSPPPSTSARPPLKTAGFECGNWRSLRIGETQQGLTADQCGEACQQTTDCQSYGFQQSAACAGEGVGEGSCILFSGSSCSLVQNECWDYYELLAKDTHCDTAAPLAVPKERAEVSAWAADLVNQMTKQEKWAMVRGTMNKGDWVGLVKGVPRLGIPPLTMQDGPQGFRTSTAQLVGQVTSWPCALAVTATWDANAMRRWAQAMGKEFKAKGTAIALGPGVNVNRVAVNGRNAEYITGEDTYLGAKFVAEFVKGMQGEGVAAVVKHFVNNEQESARTLVDVIIDERTLWEVYYPPFQAAVDAGVASVMCSYNYVNGEPACENSKTLNEDLKGTMGFDGFVMTDWDALKTGNTVGGTDQDLPAGTFFTDEVLNHTTNARLDEMVQRVLQGMARVWSANPDSLCAPGCACGQAATVPKDPEATASLVEEHRTFAQDLASQGAVLLRNENNVLPLKSSGKVAVIGQACDLRHHINIDDWLDADYYVVGGSGRVAAETATSVVQGLRKTDLTLEESTTDDLKLARAALAESQVAVVCGGATSMEDSDRSNLSLREDLFIQYVLTLASQVHVPVVVVAMAPGPIVMSWRDQASAVLLMFLSGERTGDAAAAVMAGQVNPSAKLPVTIPATELDPVPHCVASKHKHSKHTTDKFMCVYSEKLLGGWHWYDDKEVAYPFGHGLSYTTFAYSAAEGLSLPDDDGTRRVTVEVHNAGDVDGAEVVQLYLDFPPEAGMPKRVLRGFAKTPILRPDESHEVVLELTKRDLSTWDDVAHDWKLPSPSATFQVLIGASSQDIRLGGSFDLESAADLVPATPDALGRLSEVEGGSQSGSEGIWPRASTTTPEPQTSGGSRSDASEHDEEASENPRSSGQAASQDDAEEEEELEKPAGRPEPPAHEDENPVLAAWSAFQNAIAQVVSPAEPETTSEPPGPPQLVG
jgi:beta-glucosidase